MSPRVVLVGLPGSGKSTVGRRLAARLYLPFVDSDAEIEARAGKSVSEIFTVDGEAAFRALEEQVIAEVLATSDGVVALGGGAVTSPATRSLLVGLPVVWLDISPELASRRVGNGRSRPLLKDSAHSKLQQLSVERGPWYLEVAKWQVVTGDGSPERVVDRITELLNGE